MAEPGQNLKADGRAVAIRPVSISTIVIDPDYVVDFPAETKMISTGLLTLGHFRPRSTGPLFRARWAEADTILKFDILDAPESDVENFKHGTRGCSGHHTSSVIGFTDGHKYDVKLAYLGRSIFEGAIQVGLTRSEGVPAVVEGW
jgi:hypothetical protein